MDLDLRYLELINGSLGLSLLLVILIIARDLKKELLSKENKIRVPLILIGSSILVFSIKELYKYGMLIYYLDSGIPILLETLYLILTLGAFFSLLRLKELHPINIKTK